MDKHVPAAPNHGDDLEIHARLTALERAERVARQMEERRRGERTAISLSLAAGSIVVGALLLLEQLGGVAMSAPGSGSWVPQVAAIILAASAAGQVVLGFVAYRRGRKSVPGSLAASHSYPAE